MKKKKPNTKAAKAERAAKTNNEKHRENEMRRKRENRYRHDKMVETIINIATLLWVIALIAAVIYLYMVRAESKEIRQQNAFLEYERQYLAGSVL